MKMLTKSLKTLLLLCAVGFGLTACQKDKHDLYAIDSGIAQKTMLGMYSYLGIDKNNMNTVLTEWKLENGDAGRVGSKKVASTGNGQDENLSQTFTWEEAIMSEDRLSMNIPILLNGEKKTLVWRDGVIETDGYVTSKSVISMSDILRSVNDNFANLDLVYNDTVWVITIKPDTAYYLAWKTEVVYFSETEIADYKQFLIDNADTLLWFNTTYPTSAVPDTVRFAKNPQTSGQYKDLYKGVIPRSFEAFEVINDTTIHGPSQIINSEMVFNRVDKANTGNYRHHVRTWSDEFYLLPESDKAVSYDSLYEVSNAKWTPSAFTNVKKFEVLMKGDKHIKVVATKTGAETKNIEKSEDNAFHTFALSAFSQKDGEVVSEDIKYKAKSDAIVSDDNIKTE